MALLSASQYASLKRIFRAALSGNTYAPNQTVTEPTLLSFFNQLQLEFASATQMVGNEFAVLKTVMRAVLADNAYGTPSTPSDAELQLFFTQLLTDASGSAALPNAQYQVLKSLFRAMLADNSFGARVPTDADLLSYCSALYGGFTTDLQMVDRWRASDGLTNSAPLKYHGDMTFVGGTIPTAAGVDGQTVWQKTKGDGKRLVSANAFPLQGPFTLIVVAKQNGLGGAPALNDVLVSHSVAGGSLAIAWRSTALYGSLFSGVVTFAATPANNNVLVCHMHANQSRFCVNGAPYSAPQSSGATSTLGITLGAFFDGTQDSGWDIAEVIVYAGQGGPSAQWWSSFGAYAAARYPSIWPANTTFTPFSVDQTSLGGLLAAPFDVIAFIGQSNMQEMAIATTGTPTGSVFMLDKDNTVRALGTLPSVATNGVYLDRVAASNKSGIGGPIVPFANAYAAASGRPLLCVPCQRGTTGFPGDNLGSASDDWTVTYPAGIADLRCGLAGSAVARIKNAIALGGTYRMTVGYWGEAALQAGTDASAGPHWKTVLDDITAATGVDRHIIQLLYATIGGVPTTATNASLSTLAVAGKRLMSASPNSGQEADGVHNNAASCIQAAANWMALVNAQGAPWK